MASKPEGAAVVAAGEEVAVDVGVTVALAAAVGVAMFVGGTATGVPAHAAVTIIARSAIRMWRIRRVLRSARARALDSPRRGTRSRGPVRHRARAGPRPERARRAHP